MPSPFGFRTPETGIALGLGASYFFRTDTLSGAKQSRQSNLYGTWVFTEKRQTEANVNWNIFTPYERFYFRGAVGYVDFLDAFWGIGPNSLPEARERFAYKRFFIQNRFLYNLGNRTFVGLFYRQQQVYDIEFNQAGLYANDASLLGKDGSFVAGIGPVLSIDKRSNQYSAHDGFLIDVLTRFYTPILGSRFQYLGVTLEGRYFKAITKHPFWVIAANLILDHNTGDVPFRELATLGGQQINRGYFQGRFRDKMALQSQLEMRYPIWKFFHGSFFLANGQVVPKWEAWHWQNQRYTYGAGLRVLVNRKERIFVRLDYGRSTDGSSGFYIRVNESF